MDLNNSTLVKSMNSSYMILKTDILLPLLYRKINTTEIIPKKCQWMIKEFG